MKAKWSVFFIALALGLSACVDSGEDSSAQLNAEVQLIDAYLEVYHSYDDVLYDNSTGLRFIISNYGDDAPAHEGQTVRVNYYAKTFDSEGIASSAFALGDLEANIEDISPSGLQYAISVLLEGASARVFVPSQYCYGESGTTNVPPNTTIVYDLYLSEVIRTSEQELQLEEDIAAINAYISENNVEGATQLSSGIWYTSDYAGSGEYATPYSVVTFEYTLKLLTESGLGSTVEQSTLSDYGVFSLIDGLKLGFPQMRAGDKATFYIPSTLAYGTEAQTNIPANSNLVFEISLTSISQ